MVVTLAKVGTNRNALATLTSGMLSLRKPGQVLTIKEIAKAARQPIVTIRPKINTHLRTRISDGNAQVIPVFGRTRTGSVRTDGLMLSTTKLALPLLAANTDRELHLADNHLTRAGVYSETQRNI